MQFSDVTMPKLFHCLQKGLKKRKKEKPAHDVKGLSKNKWKRAESKKREPKWMQINENGMKIKRKINKNK